MKLGLGALKRALSVVDWMLHLQIFVGVVIVLIPCVSLILVFIFALQYYGLWVIPMVALLLFLGWLLFSVIEHREPEVKNKLNWMKD